jgi:uncharacterized protein (DUF924 family)
MDMHTGWPTDVLHFWFSQLTPEQWFKRDETLDQQIIARFANIHAQIEATEPSVLLVDAATARAAIIVLDQFSRNMFRGTPGAFASDAKALMLAEGAIEKKFDQGATAPERLFIYLPLEHAENVKAQARSVALISSIGVELYTNSALAHQSIIERFGRFPHRNAILGRLSTPEEKAFLLEPGSSF